ncbi:MAG: hypothetical protein JXR96_30500 [Deltaproteobacteria bacterium]|nr:hypothetical protein [Deltaproteobacteria bacterium]
MTGERMLFVCTAIALAAGPLGRAGEPPPKAMLIGVAERGSLKAWLRPMPGGGCAISLGDSLDGSTPVIQLEPDECAWEETEGKGEDLLLVPSPDGRAVALCPGWGEFAHASRGVPFFVRRGKRWREATPPQVIANGVGEIVFWLDGRHFLVDGALRREGPLLFDARLERPDPDDPMNASMASHSAVAGTLGKNRLLVLETELTSLHCGAVEWKTGSKSFRKDLRACLAVLERVDELTDEALKKALADPAGLPAELAPCRALVEFTP